MGQSLPYIAPDNTRHNTMDVALVNRMLPAEMLERVFHLLPPRDHKAAVLVCRRWSAMANHVLLSQAKLPPNLLLRVFDLLPPKDLKAVVLVCKWWREVGEAPALWSWLKLRVKEKNVGYMSDVLGSRRAQAVRRVYMREVSNKLLQAVVRHKGLKEMVIEYTNLSTLNPELLAQAVTKLEEVRIGYNPLTPEQFTAICLAVKGNSQLKTLHLYNNICSLGSVDAKILAQAVTKLEEVNLRKINLTSKQVEAIFAALDTSSRLKTLNICGNNLSSVDLDVLARGVNTLQTVDMRQTQLTGQQMTRVLTQSLLTTNLKELFMGGSARVNEELYRQAKEVIPKVKIDFPFLFQSIYKSIYNPI